MITQYIFPTVLIVLQILASLVCIYNHDYKMASYWFFAAALNAVVTYF